MIAMLKKLRNQDGFTLMEVVISIAALSVLSVFILQMFITSANANARAQNIDIATNHATNIMERFKTMNNINDIESLYAEYRVISIGDDFAFEETYGKDWAANPDGVFHLEVSIVRHPDYYDPIAVASYDAKADAPVTAPVGAVYTISVRVVDNSTSVNMFAEKKASPERVLAEYAVDKYVKYKQ